MRAWQSRVLLGRSSFICTTNSYLHCMAFCSLSSAAAFLFSLFFWSEAGFMGTTFPCMFSTCRVRVSITVLIIIEELAQIIINRDLVISYIDTHPYLPKFTRKLSFCICTITPTVWASICTRSPNWY